MKKFLFVFTAIAAFASCRPDEEATPVPHTLSGRLYSDRQATSAIDSIRINFDFISEAQIEYTLIRFNEGDTISRSEALYNYSFDSATNFISMIFHDSAAASHIDYYRLESDSLRGVEIGGADTIYAPRAFYRVR